MKNAFGTMNLLVLLAVSMIGVPAMAQKQTPPEGGPPKAFTVPANQTYALPNGMKVTLVPYGIIPKVTVSVAIDAGSINEGNTHVGVAGLTADLLKEGTERARKLCADELAKDFYLAGCPVWSKRY